MPIQICLDARCRRQRRELDGRHGDDRCREPRVQRHHSVAACERRAARRRRQGRPFAAALGRGRVPRRHWRREQARDDRAAAGARRARAPGRVSECARRPRRRSASALSRRWPWRVCVPPTPHTERASPSSGRCSTATAWTATTMPSAPAISRSIGSTPSRMHADAAVWETVIRKLSGGLMPPPGEPRPDASAPRCVRRLSRGVARCRGTHRAKSRYAGVCAA